MARKTIQMKLKAALKARGFVEDTNNRSRKYIAMRKPGSETTYFLGRGGALRAGRVASQSASIQHGQIYKILIAEGDKLLCQK